MAHEMGAMRGKVSGIGEVRDKDGNLKGTFVFEGETPLTEEELRARLNCPQPPADQKEESK